MTRRLFFEKRALGHSLMPVWGGLPGVRTRGVRVRLGWLLWDHVLPLGKCVSGWMAGLGHLTVSGGTYIS